MSDDRYNAAIYWIIRTRVRTNRYTKQYLITKNIRKISGWDVTQLVADIWGHPHWFVAQDIVDHFQRGQHGEQGQVQIDYQRDAAAIDHASVDEHDGE